MDTRPAFNVGPRATPLGENAEVDVQVHGSDGRCSIPATATAITANVIAVGPNAASFLSIWPASASNPGTSSRNYLAGQPPTPNMISVALSSSGAITLLNRFGSVDVVIDIAGYFSDHTHDDRYHTKSQVDAKLDDKADTSSVYTKSEVDDVANALDTTKADAADVYTKAEVYNKTEIDSLLPNTYVDTSDFVCSTGGGCSGYSAPIATCTGVDDFATGGSATLTSGGVTTAFPSFPFPLTGEPTGWPRRRPTWPTATRSPPTPSAAPSTEVGTSRRQTTSRVQRSLASVIAATGGVPSNLTTSTVPGKPRSSISPYGSAITPLGSRSRCIVGISTSTSRAWSQRRAAMLTADPM